jgi:predicted permease
MRTTRTHPATSTRTTSRRRPAISRANFRWRSASAARRNLDVHGTEAIEVIENDAPRGLLSDIKAERGRSRLETALARRFGPASRNVFALALAVAIWYAPAAATRVVAFFVARVPNFRVCVEAFESLLGLGVGFNPLVAAACAAATFKIVLLCVVVARLIEADRLPRETPVVLSKLAFNVCLPTYMCTRVAATLNTTPLTLGVGVLPVCAVAQVCVGGVLGAILMTSLRAVPGFVARAWRGEEGGLSDSSDASASAVARGVARAVGNADVAGAIAPGSVTKRPSDESLEKSLENGVGETPFTESRRRVATAMAESARDPMDRIGVACCAFGNTFTLPIVFLVEVLGAAFGDRVAGYVALYLIGWSPALWTAGYVLITGAAGADATRPKTSAGETVAFIAKEVCNPPMIGICLGVLIGCTPLRHVLIGNTTGSIDLTSGIPLELGVAFAAARCAFELAALVGGAALPVQTLILASSFVKPKPGEAKDTTDENATRPMMDAYDDDVSKRAGGVTGSRRGSRAEVSETFGVRFTRTASGAVAGVSKKFVAAARAAFAVDDAADVRALLVASSVRFLLLPLVGVLGSLALRAANSPWYPSDPVVAMVGLTMSAMPPAQNMVLLTNLNERTRHLAPRVGGLLVRMYVLAVVPCTVWLTVFKAAVMA